MAKKPLTPKQREVLDALDGHTVAEAADILGIKAGAVYGHVNRIRQAGHKVVLQRPPRNGRQANGSGALAPADLPEMRGATPASRNGTLDGVLGEVGREADLAIKQTRSELDEARAEEKALTDRLDEVRAYIDEHQATLGVLADVSARLHDAPINT